MLFKTIFKKIYDSEINCRIEWRWDGGFNWSIQVTKGEWGNRDFSDFFSK